MQTRRPGPAGRRLPANGRQGGGCRRRDTARSLQTAERDELKQHGAAERERKRKKPTAGWNLTGNQSFDKLKERRVVRRKNTRTHRSAWLSASSPTAILKLFFWGGWRLSYVKHVRNGKKNDFQQQRVFSSFEWE